MKTRRNDMGFGIARRQLLQMLGVAALSVPVASLWRRTARAVDGVAPKRLIVFWTPNGSIQEEVWPTGSRDSFSLGPMMEPLTAYKDDLTILKGVTFEGTGDHKTGMPFSTTGFSGQNAGISIDQEVAQATGTSSLVLIGKAKPENYSGYVSFDKSGAFVPPLESPRAAYESVFGAITGGATGGGEPSTGRDAELEVKILEAAMADVTALRARLPKAELVKMDDQLAALTQLKQSVVSPPAPIDCDQENAEFAARSFDYPTRVKLHMDLIAASFACGVRSVASLQLAPRGHDATGFGFLGVGGEIHNSIAHPAGSGDEGAKAKMRKIGLWECEQLAYLIKRLKSIPEGKGSVFDNTTILWTTECTHGNHGHTNIPIVVIGSGGGFLRPGQFLAYDKAPAYQDVLLALAHATGHPLAKFGAKSNGPLADLLA